MTASAPPPSGSLPQLWGRHGFWQIRLRWAVAPLMLTGLVVGRGLGFEFRTLPIVLIALASPLYNSVFAVLFRRWEGRLKNEPALDRTLTLLEVLADYAAMFLLVYFTGGASSPLIFFFLFHVIIAAIQFPPRRAFELAWVAAGGLWLLYAGQITRWIPGDVVRFRGQPLYLLDRPVYAAVQLLFFTATLFIAVGLVAKIMRRLRERVAEVARVSSELADANQKLQSLYAMLCVIGAERKLKPVLTTVVAELARVTEVPAVAVKLLSEDRKSLRYVAAHGLPEELIREHLVHLERSPLNQRVIEGETLVEADIARGDPLQLRQELTQLGIRSAVLVPLRVGERVIGTLGFYAPARQRFSRRDTPFLELAAELVAIAIDNAHAYEQIEELMAERGRFMLEVAHNLRAPLGAGLSILDLLEGPYLGDLNAEQRQQVERLGERLRTLNQTIGELLEIARTRDRTREIPDAEVDPAGLARHTEELFRQEAARKQLAFQVEAEPGLPPVATGANVLERVMENLVSNAIKYTPNGGSVTVRFAHGNPGEIRIEVEDTGIGIPEKEQHRLFQEFFRAANAKRLTSSGTGLGLVLVKQAVERQGGTVRIDSREGQGTRVTLDLPTRARPVAGGSAPAPPVVGERRPG